MKQVFRETKQIAGDGPLEVAFQRAFSLRQEETNAEIRRAQSKREAARDFAVRHLPCKENYTHEH